MSCIIGAYVTYHWENGMHSNNGVFACSTMAYDVGLSQQISHGQQ